MRKKDLQLAAKLSGQKVKIYVVTAEVNERNILSGINRKYFNLEAAFFDHKAAKRCVRDNEREDNRAVGEHRDYEVVELEIEDS